MTAGLSSQPWLAEIIGKPCFTLDAAAADEGLPLGPSFIDSRVPVGESDLVSALIARGFRLIGVDVQLIRAASSLTMVKVPDVMVRAAMGSDRTSVAEIAEVSFRFDRFHADADVDVDVADRIKREWALNFFNGARGDRMAVASIAGRVAGFNLLIRRSDRLVIDLIATAPEFQRRGVGQALIAFAIAQWGADMPTQVGTQLTNTASLRLYESMGFRMSAANYTFHRHGSA